jgi:hypothetical protein
MANLFVFTVAGLDYTWVGRADDQEGSHQEVQRACPDLPRYWAVFFSQGHLLDDFMNAFEAQYLSDGWYGMAPEVAVHAIASLARASFEGYRAWQNRLSSPIPVPGAEGKLIGSSAP